MGLWGAGLGHLAEGIVFTGGSVGGEVGVTGMVTPRVHSCAHAPGVPALMCGKSEQQGCRVCGGGRDGVLGAPPVRRTWEKPTLHWG